MILPYTKLGITYDISDFFGYYFNQIKGTFMFNDNMIIYVLRTYLYIIAIQY